MRGFFNPVIMYPEEYRNLEGVTQSLLTELSKHPKYLKLKLDEEDVEIQKDVFNRNFDVGNYLDIRIEKGIKGVSKVFHTIKYDLPSGDKPAKIVKTIIENKLYKGRDEEQIFQVIRDIGEEVGVGGTTWDQKRKDKVYTDNNLPQIIMEYASILETGKEPISTADSMLGNECFNALQIEENTSRFILSEQDDIELKFQTIVSGELHGVKCKGLIDVIRIDHKNNVIEIGDFKTTEYSTISSFARKSVLLKFRYDLQAAMYMLLATQMLKEKYPAYTIEPYFTFIVVSKVSLQASTVEYVPTLSDQLYNGVQYKGLKTLLEDYSFHKEKNLWDHPRDVYERGHYLFH